MRWLGQLDVPLHLNVMRSPQVTDAGWKQLKGARLLSLALARTPITDTGLVHVGMVRMLESLTITGAPISDAGLEHLQELKALESLRLRDTKVTDEGVKRLRRSLPNLRNASIGAIVARPRRIQKQMVYTVNPETKGKNAHLRARLTRALVEQLKQVPSTRQKKVWHGEIHFPFVVPNVGEAFFRNGKVAGRHRTGVFASYQRKRVVRRLIRNQNFFKKVRIAIAPLLPS